MAELRLGARVFHTSAQRDALAELRKGYVELAQRHRTLFLDGFDPEESADALFTRFPALVGAVLDETVAMAASDVARNGVYHLSDTVLRAQIEASVDGDSAAFDALHDRYLTIIGAATEGDARRTAAREGRARIVGGGFGIEGAAQGMTTAAVANAAIGLVHGLANVGAKAGAAIGDRRKKRELMQDPATRAELARFLAVIAIEGYRVAAAAVNSELGAARFDLVTPAASARGDALCANISAGRVPEAEIEAVLAEAIAANPFADRGWQLWIERLGDADGGVERSAEALGATALGPYKAILMAATRDALDWSTPERCAESGAVLEARGKALAVPFAPYRETIDRRAAELDVERRTFEGTLFATSQAAADARAAYEDRRARTAGDTEYQTIAEAVAAREAAADAASRTFAGTVFATPADAETARRRQDRAFSIFLWLAIVLGPLPSAFLTLQKGFNTRQRLFAFGWLVVLAGIVIAISREEKWVPVAVLLTLGTPICLASLVLTRGELWLRERFFWPSRP